VVDSLFHADQLVNDLSNLLDDDQLFEFPVEEMGAAELATSSPEYKAQRVLALDKLASGEPAVIVTSVSGIRRLVPQRTVSTANYIKMDGTYDLEKLNFSYIKWATFSKNWLPHPVTFQFGDPILDISVNHQDPVRIDFLIQMLIR